MKALQVLYRDIKGATFVAEHLNQLYQGRRFKVYSDFEDEWRRRQAAAAQGIALPISFHLVAGTSYCFFSKCIQTLDHLMLMQQELLPEDYKLLLRKMKFFFGVLTFKQLCLLTHLAATCIALNVISDLPTTECISFTGLPCFILLALNFVSTESRFLKRRRVCSRSIHIQVETNNG